MKRSLWLILISMLLPGLVFAKLEKWQIKAEQLVHDGKFEQAIDYLTRLSKRRDLDSMERILYAAHARSYISSYGEEKKALDVLIPVYADMLRKHGVKGREACLVRALLIQTYLHLKEFDKALDYAKLEIKVASTKNSLAEAYSTLADVYRERKEFTLALQMYRKAEKYLKQLNNGGKYNSDLGILYNNRAVTYDRMFNYQNALINYQAALKMKNTKNNSYYRTLLNMGATYRALGKPEKTKNYLIEAANYYLKTNGVNSLDYIKIENEIAVLDADYGHHYEALTRYKKVLDYGERLGRNDMKALALKNMGSAYYNLGDQKLAESYLKKALAIYEKLPPSLALADNYEGFALLASKKNSFEEELNYYNKALIIREALHQQNTPDYAQVLTNKAMAYQKHHDFQKAEATYGLSFALLEKVEPKGRKMGFLLINRATLFIKQKSYAKAEPLLLKAIEMLKESVGEYHPNVAYAYNELATVYSATYQRSKSLEYYRKAVEVAKATKGPNSASTKLYSQNLFWRAIERR